MLATIKRLFFINLLNKIKQNRIVSFVRGKQPLHVVYFALHTMAHTRARIAI